MKEYQFLTINAEREGGRCDVQLARTDKSLSNQKTRKNDNRSLAFVIPRSRPTPECFPLLNEEHTMLGPSPSPSQ